MINPLDNTILLYFFDLCIDYISIYIRRIELENIFKIHIKWDDG